MADDGLAYVSWDADQGENLSGGRRRRPKREVGVGCGIGAAGGTEETGKAGAREGELRVGVVGADMTGGKHGFNLSTDTVQGFPARHRT